MNGEESVAPAVAGTLAERPLPRLLLQLFRKRVTGKLVVLDDTGDESVVFLRDGCAVHVDRPNDLDRLDKILLESGQVSRAVMARAEEISGQTGKRLGQVLRELGAIDPQVLFEAVRAQMRRKLMRLFFVRKGGFKVFIEEHSFGQGDEFTAVRVDPRPLLLAGIRTAYDDSRLLAELQPLAAYGFRLIKLPPGFIDAIGITSTDPLVRAMNTRLVNLEELPSLSTRISDSRSMVLTLLYADLLQTELTSGTGAGVGPPAATQSLAPLIRDRSVTRPPAQPLAPGSGSPELAAAYEEGAPAAPLSAGASVSVGTGGGDALRGRIEEMAAKLEGLNFFEVLGLSESASPDQVSAAYMKGVKTFHPDRLAALNLRDLLAKTEKIAARMGQANQTLSDADQRNAYVKQLHGSKSAGDTAQTVLEAEQAFKNGETALSRGELAAALRLFNEAVAKNPLETEYRAFLAWARYIENPLRRQVLAHDTLRIVNDALAERPNFVRGLFWIGEIHKHQGNVEDASKAFKKCLELDARFIDAERELRLVEMRRKNKTGGKAQAGAKAGGTEKSDDRKSFSSFMNKILKR